MRRFGWTIAVLGLVALAPGPAAADHGAVWCDDGELEGLAQLCHGMQHGGTDASCEEGGSRWWTWNATLLVADAVGVGARESAACQADAEQYALEVQPVGSTGWWARLRWWDNDGGCGIRPEADAAGPRVGYTLPCVLDVGPPSDGSAPP